jgi:hypothetical protein
MIVAFARFSQRIGGNGEFLDNSPRSQRPTSFCQLGVNAISRFPLWGFLWHY